jgi:hypothetical protein
MGYDHSELGISASTGVTATLMVIVTLLVLYEIKIQFGAIRYPEAQHRLIFLLTAPLVIGWLTFGVLYDPASERVINVVLLGYKAAYLLFFNRYCEQLLGWTDKGGNYVYTLEKSITTLQAVGELTHKLLCRCFGKISLHTPEESEYFLKRTRILVGQLVVVLILSVVISVILEFATAHDYLNYGVQTFDSAYLYLSFIRSISTIIATYTVFLYSFALNAVPRLKHIQILAKFAVVKFAILLPELQPMIISIFCSADVISDDYSKADQIAFVNSLLVCDEMLIVAFVQLLAFNPSDYKFGHEDILVNPT